MTVVGGAVSTAVVEVVVVEVVVVELVVVEVVVVEVAPLEVLVGWIDGELAADGAGGRAASPSDPQATRGAAAATINQRQFTRQVYHPRAATTA